MRESQAIDPEQDSNVKGSHIDQGNLAAKTNQPHCFMIKIYCPLDKSSILGR
jgi:hypothetical protein